MDAHNLFEYKGCSIALARKENPQTSKDAAEKMVGTRAFYHLTQQHLLKNPEKLTKFNKILIWSGQWKAWWRVNGSGYTDNIKFAGIWSVDEAWKRVRHCGPEKCIVLQSIERRCEQCGAVITLRKPK